MRNRQSASLEGILVSSGPSQCINFCQECLRPESGIFRVLFNHAVEYRHRFFYLALGHGNLGQAALDFHEHLGVGRREIQNPGKGFPGILNSTEIPVYLALVIRDARFDVGLVRKVRARLVTGLEGLFGLAGHSKGINFCQGRLGPEVGIFLVLFDQGVECRNSLIGLALAHGDVGQAALGIHHRPCVERLDRQHLLIGLF